MQTTPMAPLQEVFHASAGLLLASALMHRCRFLANGVVAYLVAWLPLSSKGNIQYRS